MSEIAWQVFAHEVVDDEHEDDPEQHRAHRAPRDFQRQQHEGRRDHPVGGRQGSTPVQRVTSSAPFITM